MTTNDQGGLAADRTIMAPRDNLVRLARRYHIRRVALFGSAARQVLDFSAGLDAEQLQADRRTGHAIERALEIVGEAARRVSPDT